MTHESKHGSHRRSCSFAPPSPMLWGAVHRGTQFVPLDVKNKANDVTTLLLRADAGRHNHVSNRVLFFVLHYFWVSGHTSTFKPLEGKKKTFLTLEAVIITRTNTFMQAYENTTVFRKKENWQCDSWSLSPYSWVALGCACTGFDGLSAADSRNQRLENHKVLVQSQHRQLSWQPFFL